jgi:hypothetical protein
MIPNISPNGHSFRKAGAYHLHDKPTAADPRPYTSTRVLFTVTRNLAHDDACLALDEMWHTARDAAFLKQLSGAAPTGRKNNAPVKTISLAWKPGQMPDPTQMIATADSFLLSMGWHHHQAIYAAHADTAHPHIHIILNRIEPATGKTLNDWQERKRAQKWALSFEKATGPVLCQARARKYDQGQATEPAGLPHHDAQVLFGQPFVQRAATRAAIRERFKDEWAQFYRDRQRAFRQHRIELRQAQGRAASLAREGDHDRAAIALAANDDQQDTLERQFARRRLSIITARRAALRASLSQPASCDHRAERKRLLAQQAAAYAMLRSPISTKASALAHAEVELAFAHRWAELRKLPARLRSAATAALAAEQRAMLESRLAHHRRHLAHNRRLGFQHLAQIHRAERRTLAHRHGQAWLLAAQHTAAMQTITRVRAPPYARVGQCRAPPQPRTTNG